jgi:hypothetical protein
MTSLDFDKKCPTCSLPQNTVAAYESALDDSLKVHTELNKCLKELLIAKERFIGLYSMLLEGDLIRNPEREGNELSFKLARVLKLIDKQAV